MNESGVKRIIAADMKENGAYARRVEDQYGVGIYDMILIPKGLPAIFAEVKIVRGNRFGPTPRQYIELCRIQDVGINDNVVPVVIGWHDGIYYFHAPQMVIKCEDCFSVTTSEMSFHDQLVKYYHSTRITK